MLFNLLPTSILTRPQLERKPNSLKKKKKCEPSDGICAFPGDDEWA